jgi:SAM-dependent methyltransferase
MPGTENPWDRIARRCLDQVVSPLQDSVDLPLLGDLRRIRGRRRMTVADFGCGSGTLLPQLLDLYGRVVGLDGSREMLRLAARRVALERPKAIERLELRRCRLTHLHGLSERFQVAVSLNAVIMPEADQIVRALKGIRRSLRPAGRLLGVFPAVESMAEAFQFCYHKERRRLGSHRRAWSAVSNRLAAGKMNFALGVYDAGPVLEKYYSRHELERYLERAGFRDIRFGRVTYSGQLAFEGVEAYPGSPAVWHWYVRCGIAWPGGA